MPHIVLEGTVDLKTYYSRYAPASLKSGNDIFKFQNIFINQAGDTLLIEALAIESGHINRFFIQIVGRGDGATIKIYPGTDPEKTGGVKKMLAHVAQQLKDMNAGASYGTTNLKDFLL
jgi:hypothetical protein